MIYFICQDVYEPIFFLEKQDKEMSWVHTYINEKKIKIRKTVR